MPSRYIYRWYRSGSNGNHWKMTSSKVTRYLVDSLLQTEKDAGLKYDLACMEFVIQRISAYYTFVYVGPAVILGLLTAVIFLLPPADPQKATLGRHKEQAVIGMRHLDYNVCLNRVFKGKKHSTGTI